MRRICCFCESWGSGGIESFLFNLLTNMNLSEFKVDIVTTHVKKSIFTTELLGYGISLIELGGGKYNIFRNWQIFKQLLKNRKYSVVYINAFQGMSIYYARLAKKSGVHLVIVHSHNAALKRRIGYGLKMCLHRIYAALFSKYADYFWACSEAAAEFMFPKKLLKKYGFTFIPNAIDIQRFRFEPEVRKRIRRTLDVKDCVLLGCVGRLCYQKNQIFALHLLADAMNYGQRLKLLIVGSGEDEKKLCKETRRLGISNHVLFVAANKQIHELYSAMDMLIFPSRFEGFGIVAVEAQASGLPVLSSDKIPREAVYTRLCKRLPLKQKVWVNAIARERYLDQKERVEASTAAVRELKQVFDMVSVAEMIQEAFSRERIDNEEDIA